MKLKDIFQNPEGRRLELKKEMPSNVELAKTVISFANDAGGEIIIGIQDKPRKLIGIPEDKLLQIEEQIASLIYDNCSPVIIPDISVISESDLHFIKIQVYRGSDFPYFLKSKGIQNGTFIRIGSTNRLADNSIIQELQRKRNNRSFDGEMVFGKSIQELNLKSFNEQFKKLTTETVDDNILKKMQLVREQQGKIIPTNGLLLFADFEDRQEFFPYSKIECARFKGTSTEIKLDDKTIRDQIGQQPEEALKFVQRHINQSSYIEGVYTKDRWEYPISAIREVIRNAVVHRDYSLTGKDIKIAIYDDMIEISSPGNLPPSIDFEDMDARQSDIRNKVIAPVLKRMGIIDQWGNGLKIIAEEMSKYPEIEFKWFERGLQFQVQFLKQKNNILRDENVLIILLESIGTKLGLSWDQAEIDLESGWIQILKILENANEPVYLKNLMEITGWTNRSKFRSKYIHLLLEKNMLRMTFPQKPNSPNQQYLLTDLGLDVLTYLKKCTF